MPAYRQANRKMFWRIIGRLLVANPGRLFVILLALASGAAVTAALLNLQIDAKRRITTEFREFGANVIVTPRDVSQSLNSSKTLEESVLRRIAENSEAYHILSAGLLYAVVNVSVASRNGPLGRSSWTPAVLVGYSTDTYRTLLRSHPAEVSQPTGWNMPLCYAGSNVAKQLHLHARDSLFIATDTLSDSPEPSTQSDCFVQAIDSYGGTEDNQIFVNLVEIQKLTQLLGRISLVQLNVPGTPKQVEDYIVSLQRCFPDAEVRPVRQFTEGEAKIYNRISSLLTATILIILTLTFLCVMAAMTNVAMERRNDVGLMKALGGSARRIVRLFYAEAALLGLTGGLLGSTVGILLSIWLGKAVFGLAARPRLIVYPVAIMLTLLVSLASALPLRRLASIRPASVFRGEA